jgi:O-antigen/teichoic acid export membrane protein
MIRQISYFGSVFIAATSQFLVNYIFSQKLSVAEYGLFGLLVSGIGIAISLFMFGQATAISVIFFSPEKKQCINVQQEIFSSIKIIFIAFFSFSFIGITIWHNLTEKYLPLNITILALLAALVSTLQLFFISLINCMDRHLNYFFASLVGATTLIGLTVMHPTIYGYLIAVIVSGSLLIVAVSPSIKIALRNGANNTLKVFLTRELIILGWFAIPGMIISSIAGFADKFLINQFLSLNDLGIYTLGFLLSVGVGRVFVSALLKSNSILLLKSLQTGDRIECDSIFKKTEFVLSVLCLIAVFFYYTLGREFLIGIFGEKYAGSLPYLLALYIAVMVEGMMQFMAQILIQERKLYLVVANGGVLLLLGVMLNYLFIPHFQIQGAVMTFFTCNLLALGVVFIQVNKKNQRIGFPSLFFIVSLSSFFISLLYPMT